MSRRLKLAVVAALAIPLSGCGTVGMATCGIPGPVPMYFGVQADVKERIWVDVPFSAVADTVLLPFTATAYAINVVNWWTLDEKRKEESADRCPIPWEWERLGEKKKLNANKEAEPRAEQVREN